MSDDVQQGSDFEQLKRLAKQQDAEKQAQVAKDLAQKAKDSAAKQAAQDAKDRAEKERAKALLRRREEEQKRRQAEMEKLAAQKEQWKKQRQEQIQKLAQQSQKPKEKTVTKKMIRAKERAGLGKQASSGKSSSSYEHLPLTRQEKRERREREMLGISLRASKATSPAKVSGETSSLRGPTNAAPGSGQSNGLRGPPSAGSAPTSSAVRMASTNSSKPRQPAVQADATPVHSSAALRLLEEQLTKSTAAREKILRTPPSKEKEIKLRDADAAERDLRRRIAMEKKKMEERQMARIRAGLPPESPPPPSIKRGADRDEQLSNSGSKKVRTDVQAFSSSPARRESARERFLREEKERKAAKKQGQAAAAASGKSMKYDEDSDDDSLADSEDEEMDDFIDDEDEGGEVDIWSIMNPGKDRSRYLRPIEDSDEDDMEADMDSVLREEMRSARVARDEDKREEEMLRQRELEKAAKKRRAGR